MSQPTTTDELRAKQRAYKHLAEMASAVIRAWYANDIQGTTEGKLLLVELRRAVEKCE